MVHKDMRDENRSQLEATKIELEILFLSLSELYLCRERFSSRISLSIIDSKWLSVPTGDEDSHLADRRDLFINITRQESIQNICRHGKLGDRDLT